MNNTDFFNELYSQMCNESKNNCDSDKKCLITGDTLDDKYITLLCGHTFNYGSILKEVERQKYSVPKTEVQRLKKHEVKCPYCRNIQDGILPLFDGYEKIKFVNYPSKYSMKGEKCQYTFKYGKRKGELCNKPCYDLYCNMCEKKVSRQKSKNSMQKKTRKTKQNITQNNHNDNINTENTVLDETSTVSISVCNASIKSGKRKGEPCGRNIKPGATYCGLHSK